MLSSKLSEAHDKDKSSQKMSSYGAQAVSGHENLVETIRALRHVLDTLGVQIPRCEDLTRTRKDRAYAFEARLSSLDDSTSREPGGEDREFLRQRQSFRAASPEMRCKGLRSRTLQLSPSCPTSPPVTSGGKRPEGLRLKTWRAWILRRSISRLACSRS